jgi:hypothetical protein
LNVRSPDDKARRNIRLAFLLAPAMHHSSVAMVPFFEDDEDPKKPRPVAKTKKHDGWAERGESRKDEGRDGHRHVHVRC